MQVRWALVAVMVISGLQAFISSALPERISAWTSVFPLSILVWLYRVRLYSAPLLAVVAAYMNGARIVHLAHEQPRYRQLIMETASRELFGGNHTGIRITLFRDVGFWKAIPLYLYSVRHGFIRFTDIHKAYIQVWERHGTEWGKSKTFFVYSPQTSKDCDGIVPLVRQSGESLGRFDLPDISDTDLTALQHGTRLPGDVTDYMIRGNIRSLDTLQRLHVRPRHVQADLLTDSGGRTIGVLALDSVEDENPFTLSRIRQMRYYAGLISGTIPGRSGPNVK